MDERLDALLTRIAQTLAPRFDGMLSAETVDHCVRESYALLKRPSPGVPVPITRHLPILAERFARDRLLALAQAQGLEVKPVPEILYVCTRNAGRSQIAAALTMRHAAGKVHVRTAGTTPAAHVDPAVVEALAELGLDTSAEFPKPLTDDVVRAADVVITMGCGDVCPVFPGKRYLDWLLDDPAGQGIEAIRPIRDEIRRRIEKLITELQPAEH